jgi:outer membrane receptor protein involved in Fe transport
LLSTAQKLFAAKTAQKVTAGVVNAFNRNPPTVLGAFNDNYNTSLYAIRNRFYYVALSKIF